MHLLLGLVLARQHADAGGVDAHVGLDGAADEQPIADLEVGQCEGGVALHDHGSGPDLDQPTAHGQRVPRYLRERADEGDALGFVLVLDFDFTRGDAAVGVQRAFDLHRRTAHEVGERRRSIVLPDLRGVGDGHLASRDRERTPVDGIDSAFEVGLGLLVVLGGAAARNADRQAPEFSRDHRRSSQGCVLAPAAELQGGRTFGHVGQNETTGAVGACGGAAARHRDAHVRRSAAHDAALDDPAAIRGRHAVRIAGRAARRCEQHQDQHT